MAAFDGTFHVRAVKAAEPSGGKVDHRRRAVGGEIASEIAPDIDHANGGTGSVAQDCRRLLPFTLLEHQFIGTQAQRIAGQFQRHVIAAAQLELCGGFHVPFRKIGRQLDLSAGENIRRDGEDDRAGPKLALRRFDLDACAAPPFNRFYRRCQKDRQRSCKLRQQRPKALAAERTVVPLPRPREVGG